VPLIPDPRGGGKAVGDKALGGQGSGRGIRGDSKNQVQTKAQWAINRGGGLGRSGSGPKIPVSR